MKKSQVLAALALAFALGLGVVAPVANTYATITPNTATQEEKDAIYEEAADLITAVADLEDYNSYSELYKAISGENGLIEAYTDTVADQLKWFNENMTVAQSVNQYIKLASNYTRTTYGGVDMLYKQNSDGSYVYIKTGVAFKDAELKAIPQFSKVTSLTDAYNAVISAQKTVEDNIAILKTNYNYDASIAEGAAGYVPVSAAIQNYDNIKSHLSSWLNRLSNALAGVNGTVDAGVLANYIKNIDESAYDAIVENDNWNSDNAYGIMRAMNMDLVIKTAKSLPKYNFVGAVTEAAENVDKISGNTNVDYPVAQQYIAALKSAIAAYENGTPSTSVATRTLTATNNKTTVTVTGAIEEGVELKIVASDNKVAAFGDRAYKMWDLKLVKGNSEVSFTGKATVTITVPEGIDGAKAGVYFVDAQGNVQRYASTFADGKMTFTTNHFSLWAIVEDNGEVLDTPESPDTGIIASAEGSASTTVAMVAGLATALTAAGAGVVAYRNARRSTRK